jgi:hypothetical protein
MHTKVSRVVLSPLFSFILSFFAHAIALYFSANFSFCVCNIKFTFEMNAGESEITLSAQKRAKKRRLMICLTSRIFISIRKSFSVGERERERIAS